MVIRTASDLLGRADQADSDTGTQATDYRLPAFLTDLSVPGLLYAAVLRSPHPHALIRSIDASAARMAPGVHVLLTADDLPSGHRFGIQIHDRPALAVGRVRHVGEPVVALAADSREMAEAALARVVVDYELLPVLADAGQALAADAVALHPGGNLLYERHFARGDLDAAFAGADIVIENRVRTSHQAHNYIELESALVVPLDNGDLHVLAPCQGPHAIQRELALLLGWPADRIRVTGSPLGGSYGGKDDVHAQAIAALLAVRCGRPVRLAWYRADHMAAGMKRHPFDMQMRSACTADGRLLAHEVTMLLDTGAYASHGPEVLDTAVEHAGGPYAWEALAIDARLAYTNNGIAGAFRGFGSLQINTALEMQIDALAQRAGIEPIEFRRRNVMRSRHVGPLGQPIAPMPDLQQVLALLEATPLVATETDDRFMHASGQALVIKSEGFAIGGPNAARGRLGFLGAGVFELRLALTDMGQGIAEVARRVLGQRLAGLLGVSVCELRVVMGTTLRTPSAGPTSASRGTHIVTRLTTELVELLGKRLARVRGPSGSADGASASEAEVPDGGYWVETEISTAESFSRHGPAHAVFGACAAWAGLTVDRWSGRVALDRVVVVPSVGPVVSGPGYLAQIEGSVPMALGFVLTERLATKDGVFGVNNLDGYLLPTLADMPVVEVFAVDAPSAPEDTAPRGIGEIALNAVAAAIASAIAQATGQVPPQLPAACDWIRMQLEHPQEAHS